MLFAGAVLTRSRQALATLSALVRDNRELSLQWLKSNWSTFMAVFLSCLAPVVRPECLALVQGVLRGNHDCQNAVVAGLVDGLGACVPPRA